MNIIFLPSLSNKYGGPVTSTINLIDVIGDKSTLLITNNLADFKQPKNLLTKVKFINTKNFVFSKFFYEFINSKENSFIFINGCWNIVGIILILLGLILKKPVFLHPRGMLYPWSLKKNYFAKKIFLNLIYKYFQHHIEKFLCSSKNEQYFLEKYLPNAKTVIMPNYQKFEKLIIKKNSNLYLKKLLFFSRVHYKKGIELLLDSWEIYNPKGWELVICGPIDNKIKRKFLNKIEILKDKKVSYIGEVSFTKRFEIFKSCSVFILPSYQENFGNVILEALHCGLPVITTNNTPWSEIEKRFCGLIIKTEKSSILESFYWLESLNKNQIEIMSKNSIALSEKYNLDNYREEIKRSFGLIKNDKI